MSKTQPVPFFILKLFDMENYLKYRVVLVNPRGYSLQFELRCTEEEKESFRATLEKADGLVVVRIDTIG